MVQDTTQGICPRRSEDGLETEVFPTLEALFDEAEEVEEALKEEETPPPSPRKHRRRSDAQARANVLARRRTMTRRMRVMAMTARSSRRRRGKDLPAKTTSMRMRTSVRKLRTRATIHSVQGSSVWTTT
ncbi:hypothetical protein Rs2_44008 [Raphanus sativus]|nr:hypothetical protein Rs2_44008 [Raphanus sativus]